MFMLVVMGYNFPIELHGQGTQGSGLCAVVHHLVVRPLLQASHRVEDDSCSLVYGCWLFLWYHFSLMLWDLSGSQIYSEQGVTQESNKAQSWCSWKDTDGSCCNLFQTDWPPAVILGIATMFSHPMAAFVERWPNAVQTQIHSPSIMGEFHLNCLYLFLALRKTSRETTHFSEGHVFVILQNPICKWEPGSL